MKKNNLIKISAGVALSLVAGLAAANTGDASTIAGEITKTVTQGVTVLGAITAAASTLIIAGLTFVLAIKVGNWGKSAIKQS